MLVQIAILLTIMIEYFLDLFTTNLFALYTLVLQIRK